MFGPRLSLSLSGVSLISLISFKLPLMIEQTWLKGSGCLPRANTTSVNVRMWSVPATSSPQSLKQGNDGDLAPYSSIISELRSTKFSMSWAEKILKLCRTYQDVQVWGSSHMVWSTGLGQTDNDAWPSNSLTVSFIYVYIYICIYDYICILIKALKANAD